MIFLLSYICRAYKTVYMWCHKEWIKIQRSLISRVQLVKIQGMSSQRTMTQKPIPYTTLASRRCGLISILERAPETTRRGWIAGRTRIPTASDSTVEYTQHTLYTQTYMCAHVFWPDGKHSDLVIGVLIFRSFKSACVCRVGAEYTYRCIRCLRAVFALMCVGGWMLGIDILTGVRVISSLGNQDLWGIGEMVSSESIL